MLLFTELRRSVGIGYYYVALVNGRVLCCMPKFILYSVVGFLILVLLLLFVISIVILGFAGFWFLLGFQFCCSCNDVCPVALLIVT
jgi:hypothetical protein